MSGQWHYSQDGAQYGPVDEAEIIRLIQSGELAPGTPVLKVGSMDWQPARNHACFQVEIYPKRKAPAQASVKAPVKTQSPSVTTCDVIATRKSAFMPMHAPIAAALRSLRCEAGAEEPAASKQRLSLR